MTARSFSGYVDEFRSSGKLAVETAALVLAGEGEMDMHVTETTAMGRELGRHSLDWASQSMLELPLGTSSLSERRSIPSAPARSRQELGLVFMVAKRPGNAFDHISVGRADTMDVVLPLQQVSKFHAYFHRDANDQFLIADAGSTNGTWLGTRRLPVRRPESVKNAERVRLGPYVFTFMTPAGFADLVKSRAR